MSMDIPWKNLMSHTEHLRWNAQSCIRISSPALRQWCDKSLPCLFGNPALMVWPPHTYRVWTCWVLEATSYHSANMCTGWVVACSFQQGYDFGSNPGAVQAPAGARYCWRYPHSIALLHSRRKRPVRPQHIDDLWADVGSMSAGLNRIWEKSYFCWKLQATTQLEHMYWLSCSSCSL